MLSEGFMKAKNVLGSVATSVQSQVNATYNDPPRQGDPMQAQQRHQQPSNPPMGYISQQMPNPQQKTQRAAAPNFDDLFK